MTNDGFHAYAYDAEGNVLEVDNGATDSYTRDGLNHVVRTDIPINGDQAVEFYWNPFGQMVSEWNAATGAQWQGTYFWGGTPVAFYYADGKTHFEHQDSVGTERMRTSYNGAVETTIASLPFGDVVTNDGVNSYTLDSEDRVCNDVNSVTGQPWTNIYDVEGNRVAKGTVSAGKTCFPNNFAATETTIIGSGGEQATVLGPGTTWAHTNVFAGGELLATYDSAGLHFAFNDWLGTKRVQASPTGAVEDSWQSLPFGDGLVPMTEGATDQHYTGKLHDLESQLDDFGARFYEGTLGRFISPDWSAKAEPVPYSKLEDPQTLNLYAYVRNNPLTAVDPDGHMQPFLTDRFGCSEGEYCLGSAELFNSLQAATAANNAAKAQQQSQHLSPIDKVAMKAEAGALKLTRQALAGGHSAEYGGLILSKDSNGNLSATNPIHTGETTVDIDSIAVPKGYTVVGEYHTHPSTTCCESVGPSVPDVVRLRTPENASRIGYVGDAFTGQVSRYTQREPITGPYDTHTYGTVIGTIP